MNNKNMRYLNIADATHILPPLEVTVCVPVLLGDPLAGLPVTRPPGITVTGNPATGKVNC